MFSVRSLTWNAISASRAMPSAVNSSVDAFGARAARCTAWSARCCGSDRMRLKSSARQRGKLDADRKTALQFRHQIGRLGQRERARGDEQDVVGLDDAVLGRHRRAFDQRQQIALHAFARHAGAAPFAALRDLVDLVDEDDAVLLAVVDRLRLDLLVVDAACRLPRRSAAAAPARSSSLRFCAALPGERLEHAAQLAASFPPCPAAP